MIGFVVQQLVQDCNSTFGILLTESCLIFDFDGIGFR